jgi:type I restriction enzyme M protein
MTNKELKELENNLWASANSLRATGGIKSADYAVPVLGIIFLRFADNKYSLYENEINEAYLKNKGTRAQEAIEKIAIKKCGFYLAEKSRYDYLLNLPNSVSLAKAIKEAMEDIEKYQDEKFQDILPKDAYFDIEKNGSDILPELFKSFSNIPANASGDVFGKIYEYFLGNFALSEGQKGGEFFTPTSVVRFIVESIEPYSGKIYDPACGSGGMFVQSANFLEETKHEKNDIYVCGAENEASTVKLAKMNLLVNNLKGEIKKANSYEENPYDSFEKFDFVMANPPFNVKGVKEATVKNDARFTTYGLPKNKGKKDDKITDANYLWISLFATSLNDTGRAGFVMSNSASDARNSEYEIRKNIVDSGIVDVMVSIPSNMFYTVTLPATLWFFNKAKVKTPRKDKILFIDARNVYRQIDRAHREWSEENVQNLSTITRLYHGETNRYLELISKYISNFKESILGVNELFEAYKNDFDTLLNSLKTYDEVTASKRDKKQIELLAESKLLEKLASLKQIEKLNLPVLNDIETFDTDIKENDAQKNFTTNASAIVDKYDDMIKEFNEDFHLLIDIFKQSDKTLKLKANPQWSKQNLSRADKNLEESFTSLKEKIEAIKYWYENITWLQDKFPNATYEDIEGLCKVASKEEYVIEHDYSLNAGRYVGVALEEEKLSLKEYKNKLLNLNTQLELLNKESIEIQKNISKNILEMFNEIK